MLADSYDTYMKALLLGDRRTCGAIVQQNLDAHVPVKELYEELFRSSLYHVGELWEAGRISVAVEHLATAITEGLMTLVYPIIFEAPHLGHCAVVSCVANEHHQIGGKMVADTFELNGWDGYFLGANTPLPDLLRLIDEKHPAVVALSVTVYFSMGKLIGAADNIRATFPDLPIWLGGQAFRWGGKDRVEQIGNVAVLNSLSDLEGRLAAWGKSNGD